MSTRRGGAERAGSERRCDEVLEGGAAKAAERHSIVEAVGNCGEIGGELGRASIELCKEENLGLYLPIKSQPPPNTPPRSAAEYDIRLGTSQSLGNDPARSKK